jgi:5'-deoxynucleotidase YfbR-like HD superfamily hydrolase
MNKPTHADIEKLIRTIILPFHEIQRDIELPVGDRRGENDAEHSWSVAFLACALASQIDPKLDVGKIAQYGIAHDIVAIYADDTSTFASANKLASKAKRETMAVERIAQEFAHFSWVAVIVKEYERKDTEEAKFVYAVDKYIAVLYDYIDKGKFLQKQHITHEAYIRQMDIHRKKVRSHAAIAKYYEEVRALLDAHPEFFYMDV